MSFDNVIFKRFASKHIPIAERKRLEFMPDTIPYNHTKEQYDNTWRAINNTAAGKYFYTDGYTVTRVGWFTYAWQNFIGFLGFANHCEPKRAEMTLKKFLYFGYVKGYQSPTAPLVTNAIDSNFLILANSERNADVTERLQNDLTLTYSRNRPVLRPSLWQRLFSREFEYYKTSDNVTFGITLTFTEDDTLLEHAISLDPTDRSILQPLLRQIQLKPALESTISKGSTLYNAHACRRFDLYISEKLTLDKMIQTCTALGCRYGNVGEKMINIVLDKLMGMEPNLWGNSDRKLVHKAAKHHNIEALKILKKIRCRFYRYSYRSPRR